MYMYIEENFFYRSYSFYFVENILKYRLKKESDVNSLIKNHLTQQRFKQVVQLINGLSLFPSKG